MYVRNSLGSYGGLGNYWSPTFGNFSAFGGMPALCGKEGEPTETGPFLCSDIPAFNAARAEIMKVRRAAKAQGRTEDEISAITRSTRQRLIGPLRGRARAAISAAAAAPAPRPASPAPRPAAPAPTPMVSTVPAPAASSPAISTASYSQTPITPGAQTQTVQTVQTSALPPGALPPGMMMLPQQMMVRPPVGAMQMRQAPAQMRRGPARVAPKMGGKKLPVAAGIAALAAMMFM